MFVNVQPLEGQPRLVNIAHIVQLTGDMILLSTGSTFRVSPETLLRLNSILPKLEG